MAVQCIFFGLVFINCSGYTLQTLKIKLVKMKGIELLTMCVFEQLRLWASLKLLTMGELIQNHLS